MVVYHSALTAAVANIRMTTDVVHPMLAALETTCVSILMYSKVADRILEQAVLSKHVCQCNVFLAAKNNTCRHNALTAVVANIRMTTDVVHPMLTALETTCVSILMYSKVADRILEHSDLKYCAFLL